MINKKIKEAEHIAMSMVCISQHIESLAPCGYHFQKALTQLMIAVFFLNFPKYLQLTKVKSEFLVFFPKLVLVQSLITHCA